MTTTTGNARTRPDPKAAQVAARLRSAVDSELVILFGSRARGEYNALQSDIDIMLLQGAEPDAARKEALSTAAQAAAQETYGYAVPVQLVWRDLATFRRNRRYTNSVETNAVREGIIMPRHPENYQAADYEDAETEYEYNWGDYENRLFHAEQHLELFGVTVERGMSDLLIGQEAQRTLEHGLKALIAAHGADYPKTHNIGALIGKVRESDHRMQHFRLSIPADVYTEYAGEDAYQEGRRLPELTAHENYLAKTLHDAQFIIERAKTIRARSKQDD